MKTKIRLKKKRKIEEKTLKKKPHNENKNSIKKK